METEYFTVAIGVDGLYVINPNKSDNSTASEPVYKIPFEKSLDPEELAETAFSNISETHDLIFQHIDLADKEATLKFKRIGSFGYYESDDGKCSFTLQTDPLRSLLASVSRIASAAIMDSELFEGDLLEFIYDFVDLEKTPDSKGRPSTTTRELMNRLITFYEEKLA